MALLNSAAILIVALLPALVWLLFFLKEDPHPEPRRLVGHALWIGALATIPALAIQLMLKELFARENPVLWFFALALVEEIFKFAAAYYAINRNEEFDEPIDAMIYMIAAAAGFASVENVLIAFTTQTVHTLNGFSLTTDLLLLRFVGATLLHVLTAGIIGYGWAKSRLCNRPDLLVRGLVLATFVHAAFNILVAVFQEKNLFYASTILLTAAFFVLTDFEILKKKAAP